MQPLNESEQASVARHNLHLRRVQTGIATQMDQGSKDTEPKHLRVGIDSLFADAKGLATLLLAKGVFTREEYLAAIAQSMEEEADGMEASLSAKLGAKVTLAPCGL